MKFFKKVVLLSVAVAGTGLALGGCRSNVKMPVTFVASTSSAYNAEVEIGDYVYKFRGKVDQKSDNFLLEGLVQQRKKPAEQGGGGGKAPLREGEPGGQPGGDFGGGDFGGGEQQGGPDGEQQGQPGGEQQGGQPGGEQQGGQGGPGGGQQGGPGGGQQQKADPTTIAINLDKTEIFINEQVEAKVAVEPSGADDSVTWASSNEEIATVKDGKITGVNEGTAVITATSSKVQGLSASKTVTVVKEDLASHNWSLTGKWKLDEGYGYVITLDDANKTEIHADFDKIQGRHQFYYTVEIENVKSTILFQAKDPTFKDRLAKDYKSWDERDSKYIYYAKATGNNNSVATAYLYLHKDGSGVINAPKSGSADRTSTFGLTWTENNGIITLVQDGKQYVSKTSVNAAHPGSLLPTADYTFLRSDNPEVKWKKMVVSDFEGATTHEYSGSYTTTGPDGKTTNVQLCLFATGEAKIYEVGNFTALAEGTWTETEGVVSAKLGNQVCIENPDHSIDCKISVKTSKGSSEYNVNFARTK